MQVANGKTLGQYTITGLASDRLDVQEAQVKFDALGLRVPAAERSRSAREPNYPEAFELVMEIPPPDEAASAKKSGK